MPLKFVKHFLNHEGTQRNAKEETLRKKRVHNMILTPQAKPLRVFTLFAVLHSSNQRTKNDEEITNLLSIMMKHFLTTKAHKDTLRKTRVDILIDTPPAKPLRVFAFLVVLHSSNLHM